MFRSRPEGDRARIEFGWLEASFSEGLGLGAKVKVSIQVWLRDHSILARTLPNLHVQ